MRVRDRVLTKIELQGLVCARVCVSYRGWCLNMTVSALGCLLVCVCVCRLILLAAVQGNFSLAPQKLVSQALIVAPLLCISP